MIFKIIGSIIIIASSCAIGYYIGNQESFRISDLTEMKRAIAILKSEIEFSKSSLPSAFFNISERTKNPIGRMFTLIYERLTIEPYSGIGQIWEDCIVSYRVKTYFSDDDVAQMISFGKTLGYLDSEMQSASIMLLSDYIDVRVSELNACRDKNKRMYNSLGALGGLLLVVLLL